VDQNVSEVVVIEYNYGDYIMSRFLFENSEISFSYNAIMFLEFLTIAKQLSYY